MIAEGRALLAGSTTELDDDPDLALLLAVAGADLLDGETRIFGTGERRVVVTPEQVEQLAAQFSRTWLRPPMPNELDGLVERYVRSEIYYREALALGLAGGLLRWAMLLLLGGLALLLLPDLLALAKAVARFRITIWPASSPVRGMTSHN